MRKPRARKGQDTRYPKKKREEGVDNANICSYNRDHPVTDDRVWRTCRMDKPTERELLYKVLEKLNDTFIHMVYVFSKTLLNEQNK